MDVPCSIQGNIHAFSLIINVSRILGTYHIWRFFFGCSLYVRLGTSFLVSRVELGLTGLTSTSRSIRTTCAKSFALLRSSDSFLSAFSHILVVELDLAEMACVSRNVRRTLHVPSGVPVQCFSPERSPSYP